MPIKEFQFLSISDLKLELAKIKSAFVNMDDFFYEFAIANIILRKTLGETWSQKYINLIENRNDYFKIDNQNEYNQMEAQLRLLRFADAIYILKFCPNYSRFIQELKTRDVFGAAFELYVARSLFDKKILACFKKITGIKGEDYDLIAQFDNKFIAIELKYKHDGWEYSQKRFHDFLNKSRQQLPKSKPGVLIIRIPNLWTYDPEIRELVRQQIENFLNRETKRINAITLIWEDPMLYKLKLVKTLKYFTFINPNPHFCVSNIENFYKPEQIKVLEHTRFWLELCR